MIFVANLNLAQAGRLIIYKIYKTSLRVVNFFKNQNFYDNVLLFYSFFLYICRHDLKIYAFGYQNVSLNLVV